MDITRIVNVNNWLLYRIAVRLSSIVPRKTKRLRESRIIFVAGVEGSGTSIMERLIGAHQGVLQTKHTYEHPLERPNCDRIELLQRISVSWRIHAALDRLWETRPPCSDHSRLDEISTLQDIRWWPPTRWCPPSTYLLAPSGLLRSARPHRLSRVEVAPCQPTSRPHSARPRR